MGSSLLTILSLGALATAGATPDPASDLVRKADDCDAVHLFLARGNNEPYPGRQAAMVESICDGVSSCGYEDLHYSTLYTDLSCQSGYDGVVAAYEQVSDYACKCPDAKLILLGYSQGAQVFTDFLGGGGVTGFGDCIQPPTDALNITTSPGNRISAVVVFGDTRHTANQPFNQGAGSGIDGIFPRSGAQLAALNDYSDILYSYCDGGDPICAAKQSEDNYDTEEHLNYYNVYASAAASWAKSVASIMDDSNSKTTVPLSISGTAEDYATIASDFAPSGSVTTQAISTATCSAATTSKHTASSKTKSAKSTEGEPSSTAADTTAESTTPTKSATSKKSTSTATSASSSTSSTGSTDEASSSTSTEVTTTTTTGGAPQITTFKYLAPVPAIALALLAV